MKDDAGYSLLEVLVAFAILVLALGGLYQAIAGGAQSMVRADKYAHALMLAESKLKTLGTEKPLAVGRDAGQFRETDYAWDIVITPYDGTPLPQNQRARPTHQLFHVALTVAWQDGRRRRDVVLTTLRLEALAR